MRKLRSLFLASLIVSAFATPMAVPSAFAETRSGAQAKDQEIARANLNAFNEAWQTVRDNFYDAKMEGLDWDLVGRRYRIFADWPNADIADIIKRMLAELRASHTGYYTPDEIAYYDLADIFSRGLSRELAQRFPKGEVAYDGIGMATRVIDGRHFISGVYDGFPAAQAKLLVGDEIISADGSAFAPVRSFAGKVGKTVRLTIRREAQGPPITVEVTPQLLHPNDTYLAAMKNGARVIEKDGRKLAYVHVWSYARREYQDLLEELVEDRFKDADGLIWDLRDGWGGGQPYYLDIFNARAPTVTFKDRRSSGTQNARWRKPVVLIINGGSRSAKEILAYGFKKYGYGEVVGTRTTGAVLAGRAYIQSNGSLLLVAVSDVAVDDERLEGVGVAPDHEVPFDIRYAKGADPQLAAALDVLLRKLTSP
ncbi:S41 family peptidase [Taklimakanibacter lacteus]|uniref:S41 family peptidase n=1 Tax=Taklimakanibacter lacteus TaxID=2268456 RepID=UPI000E6729AB